MNIPQQPRAYAEDINRIYGTGYSENEFLIGVPSITFQVTDNCNLRCSYCYQINKGTHKMPLQIAKDFIDILIENNEKTQQYLDTSYCSGVTLEFIGGEPLLEVELIDQILEYFQQTTILKNHIWARNWRAGVSSNGTLYFNPEVQKFIKKYFDHLSFNVSIDGNKQLHDTCRKFPDGSGSYDIAIAAVKDYIDNLKGDMGSKITLSPDNIIYTFEAIKDFIEFGYTKIFANCIFEKGWTIEYAKIFYKELKKIADYLLQNDLEEKIFLSLFISNGFHPCDEDDQHNWCGGNGRMLALDYKGDIYPCIRYMESSLGPTVPPIIIGNTRDGFLPTQKEIECVKCLKAVNRLTQSTEECIKCPIAKGCAWCQGYNYQCSGDFNHRQTNICIMHKARALANAYFWNKAYIKHNDEDRMHLYLPEEDALKIISKEEYEEIKKLELI